MYQITANFPREERYGPTSQLAPLQFLGSELCAPSRTLPLDQMQPEDSLFGESARPLPLFDGGGL